MLELIVRGGTVVDGTGAPGIRADVGVEDGRIAAIGSLAGAESVRSLDAGGMVVAPGFIDIHSHSDFTLLVDPRAQSAVAQGVTTELIGNCGHGCAPITEPERHTANIYGYDPSVEIDWRTTAEYLDRLDAGRPAVNVAALVPNGNLRLATMADPGEAASPDEVRRMGMLLEEGLEAGAYGYSNGLEYPLESAATEGETAELCRIAARVGALYATHERNKDIHAVEAIEEGIRVAQASGVRLQLSHVVPRRGSPPGSLERIAALVEEARASGVDAAFDAHTRLHGILNASAALPAWALEGGPDDLRARLEDGATRGRVKAHRSIVSNLQVVGWDRLFLFTSWARPGDVGRSFAEMAQRVGDPFDALLDLLLDEADDPHRSLIISHAYEEEWLRQAFRHPLCTLESDATALCMDGPLADTLFLGAYTWAAWFFRRFVRETKDFTIEEAARKLSAAPAERIGLADRGALTKGAAADIVAFDPDRFREAGTLEDPNQIAEGVEHVVVNGGIAMEGGRLSGQRFGRALRSLLRRQRRLRLRLVSAASALAGRSAGDSGYTGMPELP